MKNVSQGPANSGVPHANPENGSGTLGPPNIEYSCSMFECLFMFGEDSTTRTQIMNHD